MPFLSLNHSLRACHQGLHFFTLPRFHCKIASPANFRGPVLTESCLQSHVWFVKIVCSLYVQCNSSMDTVFSTDYFRTHLDTSIAFDVVKHVNCGLNNPSLALSFFQFTRLSLNLVHSLGTYNLLVRSFCQMGLHDSAKLVLDSMRDDGHFPDGSLLCFSVSSFGNDGNFEVAMELLIAHARSWSEALETVSCFIFNNLLSLLVKRNRADEAVAFFRNHIVCSKCYSPDTSSFNIAIRGLCTLEKIDEAFEFFHDMGGFSCLPDLITYNTLLNGLCRIENVVRAQELLRDIHTHVNLSPNVVTYTSVISGYCKLGWRRL